MNGIHYFYSRSLCSHNMEKKIIGRIEYADLPIFRLKNQLVKIDTGAYTSSIGVYSIELINNELHVVFQAGESIVVFSRFQTKKIKSSNGIFEDRFVVEGEIVLGGESYFTPFSITNRSAMKYPILLGRKLLNKRFLVDSSQKFICK